MLISYRPELENPPMAQECVIGFSFIGKTGETQRISLESGLNRDFPDEIWEKIKDYTVVKRLMALGALRIETEEAVQAREEEAAAPPADTLANFSLPNAMRLIEESSDEDRLRAWKKGEGRIKVLNAINKRITAINEGKG